MLIILWILTTGLISTAAYLKGKDKGWYQGFESGNYKLTRGSWDELLQSVIEGIKLNEGYRLELSSKSKKKGATVDQFVVVTPYGMRLDVSNDSRKNDILLAFHELGKIQQAQKYLEEHKD